VFPFHAVQPQSEPPPCLPPSPAPTFALPHRLPLHTSEQATRLVRLASSLCTSHIACRISLCLSNTRTQHSPASQSPPHLHKPHPVGRTPSACSTRGSRHTSPSSQSQLTSTLSPSTSDPPPLCHSPFPAPLCFLFFSRQGKHGAALQCERAGQSSPATGTTRKPDKADPPRDPVLARL
jgi:hypothetical protein